MTINSSSLFPFLFLLFLLSCPSVLCSSGKVFNILDYGAKGDNSTINTFAIQAALDASRHAGGGTVVIPAPGVFKTGSIWLSSNLNFVIEKGAVLSAVWPGWNHTYVHYPSVYARGNGKMQFVHAGILNGARCLKFSSTPTAPGDQCLLWDTMKNITIQGHGTIDGTGQVWWTCDNAPDQICPDGCIYGDARPTTMSLHWIKDLVIKEIHIINSPFWTIHTAFCHGVEIKGVSIHTPNNHLKPGGSHETDGIHIDSSKDVWVHDCEVSTGDDDIAISSGKDLDGRLIGIPSTNITVEDCKFYHGHGASLGSGTSGGISDVIFRRIAFDGTDNAMRIKSARGRGGTVQNILYEDVTMKNIGADDSSSKKANFGCGINFAMYYQGTPPPTNKTATPVFKDITLRNITGDCMHAAYLIGLPESPIQGLTFQDILLKPSGYAFNCSYLKDPVWKNVQPDHC